MKVKVSISLDYEVLEKIKILAELTDRSVSQYVNMLLKRSLDAPQSQKSEKRQEISDLAPDRDAGR
jgi:predicted transcriptional regulator